MSQGQMVGGFIVPGKIHILLAPEQNEGWQRLHDAYKKVKEAIARLKPDVLLLYSSQWVSIIGHQMQKDPNPRWRYVDDDFHELGTIDYDLLIDPAFADAYQKAAKARGLTARTTAYKGFPIDGGSLTALKLLNPDNKVPASIVSCNMYADRSETIVLGKAAVDAAVKEGKRVVCVAVTGLSHRMWTTWRAPHTDKIHSSKDDEWNRKILELLSEGRLEDVSQLAREFYRQANADSKLKAVWWLSACLGESNHFDGHVYAYEPVWGTGAALVSLLPSQEKQGSLEYDEDGTDFFKGDRNVLSN